MNSLSRLKTCALALSLSMAPLSCGAVGPDAPEEDVDTVTSALGTTVTVGTPSSMPVGTVYDGSNIYMVEDVCNIRFEKMSLSSGAKTSLLFGCDSVDELQVDSSALFFIARGSNQILKTPLNGGSSTLITATASAIGNRGFDSDSSNLYWADATGIRKHPKSSGSTSTLFAGADTKLLDVDSSFAYFERYVSSTNSYVLQRVPIGGGSATTIFTNNAPVSGFALDSSNAYVATFSNTVPGVLARFSKSSLARTVMQSPTADCVTSIAVNSSNLYMAESPGCDALASNGVIIRRTTPSGSGTFSTQKTGLHGPRSLHLSSTDLYWVSGGSSPLVKRAPLP